MARSLTRADRKSVWVQWSHYQSGQRLLGQSLVRFYLCHHAGLPVRIMLAEYLQVPEQAQPQDLPLEPRSGTAG